MTKNGQRSDAEAINCGYIVKEVTRCAVNIMFIADLHGIQKLPEGTALHNVCDILHVQLVSDVWLVTAIYVHGLRICHPGKLLRKLHPHHLNHCKHGCVHKHLYQFWQARFVRMPHAQHPLLAASDNQTELHACSKCMCHAPYACSSDRACLLGCDCTCCACACGPTAEGMP